MAYWTMLAADLPQGTLLKAITLRTAILAVLIAAGGFLLIRYVSKIAESLSTRNAEARFVLKWIEQVSRLVLSFATIFAVILVLAPSSDAFLAAVGSAAIAIALGAQDLIKNVVGGLVILTDRPYQLGDRVRMGDTAGEVVHIGLRSTKLRTLEDTLVTVSNSDLLNGQATNTTGS